jgi:hypothetical protein
MRAKRNGAPLAGRASAGFRANESLDRRNACGGNNELLCRWGFIREMVFEIRKIVRAR